MGNIQGHISLHHCLFQKMCWIRDYKLKRNRLVIDRLLLDELVILILVPRFQTKSLNLIILLKMCFSIT